MCMQKYIPLKIFLMKLGKQVIMVELKMCITCNISTVFIPKQ